MFCSSSSWFILFFGLQNVLSQQTTTVTLMDWGYSGQPASVITADDAATTYSFFCPPDNTVGCATEVRITAVGGPSTAAVTVSEDSGSVSYEYACDITSSTTGRCTHEAASGGVFVSTVYPLDPSDITWIPIVATAGVENLQPGTASATATAPATLPTSGATPTSTITNTLSSQGT